MLEFIRRHSGLLGLAGTVLFGVLSVYFYLQQREYVEIAYTKSTVKIVESDDLTPSIRVIGKNGEAIVQDIFVSDIAIWNSGTVPIGKEIVRKDITVKVGDGSSIIDARIADQTHPDLAEFRLMEVSTDPRTRYLDWDYFDPGFGLKLVIITAGSYEPVITFDGYILGTDEFVEALGIDKGGRSLLAFVQSLLLVLLLVFIINSIIRLEGGQAKILSGGIFHITMRSILFMLTILAILSVLYFAYENTANIFSVRSSPL